MHFLDELNPEQREAVLHVDGPLLILAGAGSGKTRVIAYRIAHLIGGGIARPDEVLAVTFTNKAAEEMRSRVEGLVGASCRQAWISTFHSSCARILRREAESVGLPRDFVIYDTDDQKTVMKRVLKDLGIDEALLQPAGALAAISRAKNRMEGPESFSETGFNLRERHLRKVFERYRAALDASHAVDFDDLLVKTVELFERAPSVGQAYARRFRFILVDEYQDTNRPQYVLVHRLAAGHRNLCVVGDPDQSIYKWRGADIRNILDFERDFPEASIVRLERNYRSTQVILDAASALIRHNVDRKDKRLWTDRKGGAKVTVYAAADEWDEAEFVARTARDAASAGDPAEVGVLYRTNAQSRVLEDVLRREGVSYRIVGGVSFYERKEVKDAVAYLKLLLNSDDEVSLRRIVNVPSRGIGPSVLSAVEQLPSQVELPDGSLRATGRGLWSRLQVGLETGQFTGRTATVLGAFRDLMRGLAEAASRETVSTLIGLVLDRTGYLQDLREDRDPESQGRIENLMELVSAAREFEARAGEEATLAGFIDRLSLVSDTDKVKGSDRARVTLMTLHSAKGLEFPVVCLTGLEEGLFPHSRSANENDELEEERRLCYVGMTRARSRLALCWAARRRVFGEYQPCSPSRFLEEVPSALVDAGSSYKPSLFGDSVAGGGFGRGGARRSGIEQGASARRGVHYDYSSEDQSPRGISLGARVRHDRFGLGTVVGLEDEGEDLKVTVRFVNVGVKRLIAKYARLDVV